MIKTDRRRLVAALSGGALAAASPAVAQAPQSRSGRFEGKVVAITGATSGIGRAAAEAFVREGASVGFCGRREALGREVEAALREGGGEAIYIRADVRDPAQVQRFVDGVAERFGGLDVAFNNAGVNWFKPLHETTLDEWNEMAETNTRGVFLAMKHQIPHMVRRGGGTIVITSSFHENATRPGAAAYASSKRALMGLCQAAALDYGRQNIRVNVLSPGIINTRMFTDRLRTEVERADAARTVDALQRVGTASEMAGAVLFLASDECRYLTGASLLADGGLMAGV